MTKRKKTQGKTQTLLQVKQVWGAHLSEERAIKLNNVGAVTASHHHIKVHQKLLLLLLIHCRPNSLKEEEWQRLHHFHAITAASALLLETSHGQACSKTLWRTKQCSQIRNATEHF